MQSYQLHIVSQQLRRRHPYLQPPFRARYDSTQVYKAVFDRCVPKLIQILLTEDLPSNRYASALITLNQMASDEAEKSNMIEAGIVGIASAFCHCKDIAIRREATLLVGLLGSTISGLKSLGSDAYEAIGKLLFDEELEVRMAVAWCIARMVLSRLGSELLCKNSITQKIVQSFLKYSGNNDPKQEYFVTYLLEAFKHILAYDDGIKFCLSTGLTSRLCSLTLTEIYTQSEQANEKIHSLALCALGNMAMNHDGKQQCINQRAISFAQTFLTSKDKDQVSNAVSVIMFCAIHLQGKKQCVYNDDKKVDTMIVSKIIKLLDNSDLQETTKDDVRETLKIIAQEGDGFLSIADIMSRQCSVSHIEQIFGPSIIVPLALLLPEPMKLPEPPTLPSTKINDYKSYVKTINHFMKNFNPEAVEVGLKECVDLAGKLVVFLCYRGDKILQDGTAQTLLKLVESHQYSGKVINEFLSRYGDVQHKISKTTVENQLKSYENLSKALGIKKQ